MILEYISCRWVFSTNIAICFMFDFHMLLKNLCCEHWNHTLYILSCIIFICVHSLFCLPTWNHKNCIFAMHLRDMYYLTVFLHILHSHIQHFYYECFSCDIARLFSFLWNQKLYIFFMYVFSMNEYFQNLKWHFYIPVYFSSFNSLCKKGIVDFLNFSV